MNKKKKQKCFFILFFFFWNHNYLLKKIMLTLERCIKYSLGSSHLCVIFVIVAFSYGLLYLSVCLMHKQTNNRFLWPGACVTDHKNKRKVWVLTASNSSTNLKSSWSPRCLYPNINCHKSRCCLFFPLFIFHCFFFFLTKKKK